MANLLIVVNKYNKEAITAADNLADYCKNKFYGYDIYGAWDIKSSNDLPNKDYDFAVVLGGDGTVLRTSNFIGSRNIPILGINYGNLGFLTNSREVGVEKLVELALDNKLKTESRSHLLIEVTTDKEKYNFIALNEACVRRSESGRIVDFAININNEYVCKLRSDGVIASTATGSTAYALAAGGPLVAPTYKGVIIVPLAPHTLNSRPLVTGTEDIVEFDFTLDSKIDPLAISIDGELKKIEGKVLHAIVKSDKKQTTILRYNNETFYSRISKVFF